jgi:hypothetical protein
VRRRPHGLSRHVAAFALLALLATTALAEDARPGPSGAGEAVLFSMAARVAAPEAPLEAVEAMPPREAPEGFDLDPAHVAYVVAPRLSVVRLMAPASAGLRLLRLVEGRGEGPRAWLEERPASPAEGVLDFVATERSVLRLEVTSPARVRIERGAEAVARRGYEDALEQTLAWIDRGAGEPPSLPPGAAALADALALDAYLGAQAATEVPAGAIRAYRRASALLAFLVARPADPRFVRATRPGGPWTALAELGGPDAVPARLRRLDADASSVVEVTGPAVLSVRVRAVGPGAAPWRHLRVALDGAPLLRLPVRASARRLDADGLRAALGWLDADADLEATGPETERRLVVPAGAHRLALRAEGGGLGIDAAVLTRRPRLWHALTGDEDPAALLSEARRAAAAAAGTMAGARAFEAALAALEGGAPGAFDALVAALGEPDEPEVAPWARALLRVRCAREPALAEALLATLEDPRAALACAAEAPDAVDRSTYLRLLAAFLAAPTDADLVAELALVPRPAGTWTRVPGGPASDLRLVLPAEAGAGDLRSLGPAPQTFTVVPSSLDPARPGRVRLFAVGEPGAAVTASVDGVDYAATASGGVDRWELGLPPGPHRFASEGHVFLRVAPPVEGVASHRLHAMTTLAPGAPLVWREVTGPLRIAVRPLDDAPARIDVQRGDELTRELRVERGAVTTAAFGVSSPAGEAVWLELPAASAETLSLAAAEGWVAVAVYALGAGAPATAEEAALEEAPEDVAAPAPASASALLDRVRGASEALFGGPSVAAWLDRAEALGGLGHLERAQHDLARARALGASATALAGLERLLASQSGRTHLALTGAPAGVLPLSPYELAVAPDRAEERGEARRAWALREAGRPRDAARALESLAASGARDEAAAAALQAAALRAWAEAFPRDPEAAADAARTFGLARAAAMRSEGSRAAEARAARLSRWQAVGPTRSAGYERIELLAREPPSEAEALAAALLGAASPDAFVVWPGQRVELAPVASLTDLVLRCGEPPGDDPGGCPFELRIDEGPAAPRTLAHGAQEVVPLAATARTVTVSLSDGSAAPGLVWVRAPGAGGFRLRVLGHVATEATPVVFEVLGNATLELDVRGIDGARRAEVQIGDGEAAARWSVELPERSVEARVLPRRAARLGARRLVTIPLPQPGVVPISVRSEGGEVLVRARLRVPREAPAGGFGPGPEASPEVGDARASAPVAGPLPTLALPSLSELPRPGSVGTFSIALGYLSHDVTEVDEVARATSYLGVSIAHRIALLPERLWLRTQLDARFRLEIDPAVGARIVLHAADVGLGIRASLLGGVDAMPSAPDVSVRGQLSLDRPISLDPDLSLTPRIVLTAFHATAEAPVNPTGIDFEVWNSYRRNHPVQLLPSLSLRWDPAPDARFELQPALALNSDVQSVDRLELGVGVGLVSDLLGPRTMLVRLGYQPGYRFPDLHRRIGYLRHDVSMDLDLYLVLGRDLRLVGSLAGTLFVRESSLDAIASFTLRLDVLDGRGLGDFAPTESYLGGVLAAEDPRSAFVR